MIGAMPGVVRVTARPIADPMRENEIGVDIAGDVTESAVRQWCAVQLAAYKQPAVARSELTAEER